MRVDKAMVSLVGAHVSSKGGVSEAVPRIAELGGTAFALFLKNEKQWTAKPLSDEEIAKWKQNCETHKFNPGVDVLPHGSYLINLGNPDAEKRKMSMRGLLDDLQRCEKLGIGLYNLHPGSSLGTSKTTAIENIAEGINKAHKETSSVKVVLENMTGNEERIVGTRLEDLADIIEGVENKDRVGVCIDTCHSLAAGYDLRDKKSFDAFWDKFDKVVGYKYLAGIHLNDSKYPIHSKRDVHQNLGLGFVGLECFRLIMNKPELEQVPKVLETPMITDTIRKEEVELLNWLIGRSADDKEFLAKSDELQSAGAAERKACDVKTQKKQTKQMTFKPVKKRKVEEPIAEKVEEKA